MHLKEDVLGPTENLNIGIPSYSKFTCKLSPPEIHPNLSCYGRLTAKLLLVNPRPCHQGEETDRHQSREKCKITDGHKPTAMGLFSPSQKEKL